MFTGIIEHLGRVVRAQKVNKGMKLTVDAGNLAKQVKDSDSVAVNGTCLTVTGKKGAHLSFDAVSETLNRTNLGGVKTGSQVNLEQAIRAGQPFGGHFVQGHIDCVGRISNKVKQGEGAVIEISIPPEFSKYLIEKGSIAVDGISLTIAKLGRTSASFQIAVIPFTLKHTTLGKKTAGDTVNIEVDIMGKWVSKLLAQSDITSGGQQSADEGF
ncbi:MAG: riboflavin synthase [Planctomycetes bacterium]|nr:riboflavin synthase [Planctomycetota bacterium]